MCRVKDTHSFCNLPVGDIIDSHFNQLSAIKSSDPNETFTLIDGYGTDLLDAHRAYLALKRSLTPECFKTVSRAKILQEVTLRSMLLR